MLFTPSGRVVADTPVVSGADLRRIRPRRDLYRDPSGDVPGYAVAAYGGALPPPGRQWNFVTDEGDLFKGGFGGQGRARRSEARPQVETDVVAALQLSAAVRH
jgi:hypothetical protein